MLLTKEMQEQPQYFVSCISALRKASFATAVFHNRGLESKVAIGCEGAYRWVHALMSLYIPRGS